MNIKLNLIFLLLIVGIVTTSGCISENGATTNITSINASTNHYTGNNVSFDYPNTWNMYTFMEPLFTFAVGNYSSNTTKFLIMTSFDSNSNFTEEKEFLLGTVGNGQEIVSQRELIVANTPAYQIVVNDSGQYIIETIIVKDYKLYLIVIATDQLNYNETQAELDIILKSFHIGN